jgi:hypothetical protein
MSNSPVRYGGELANADPTSLVYGAFLAWARDHGVEDQVGKLHWDAFEAGMRYGQGTTTQSPPTSPDIDHSAVLKFDERTQRTIIEALRYFMEADPIPGLLVSEEIQNLIATLEKDLADRSELS